MVIKKTPGCHDFFVLIFFIRYFTFCDHGLVDSVAGLNRRKEEIADVF